VSTLLLIAPILTAVAFGIAIGFRWGARRSLASALRWQTLHRLAVESRDDWSQTATRWRERSYAYRDDAEQQRAAAVGYATALVRLQSDVERELALRGVPRGQACHPVIARAAAFTARRVACPTCGAPRFEHCLGLAGEILERSHAERVDASRDASDLTPGQLEALRQLHVDPTRRIEPAMRKALLRRRLIEPAAPVGPTPGDRRETAPKRRHPLTAAVRAAIGVEADAQELAS
jgi:hypothetical protein